MVVGLSLLADSRDKSDECAIFELGIFRHVVSERWAKWVGSSVRGVEVL